MIECCFVDDEDDVILYNASKMAKSIVRGITGKEIFTSFKVIINVKKLNVRQKATTNSKIVTQVKEGQVYTIVDERNGWGQLKSGVGWIKLSYTKKI